MVHCEIIGCERAATRGAKTGHKYCPAHYERSLIGASMTPPVRRYGSLPLSYDPEKVVPETEKAWCAGFFDGEGCIYVGMQKKGKTAIVTMIISQTDKRPLDRFLEAAQLGSITGPYHKAPPRKPIWSWTVSGAAKVNVVLNLLWPYLSEPKKEQAKKMKQKKIDLDAERCM